MDEAAASAREVVVTGVGTLLPGCDGTDTLWSVLTGHSRLRTCDVPGFSRPVPLGVVDTDPIPRIERFPERYRKRWSREVQLYLSALCEALDHSGVPVPVLASDRVGLFDGVARPAFRHWVERGEVPPTRADLLSGTPGQAAGIAASLLGIRGPAYTLTTTCASGAVALGQAWMHIRGGLLDLAIAGGHESSLCGPLFDMYEEAGLLSRGDPQEAIRPWSDSATNAFGEGAVQLVLESRANAAAHGRRPVASIRGFVLGNSGRHPTSVDVDGRRPAELIEQVLEAAGVSPAEVSFVIGHGNGVRQSDRSELAYMRRVFGDRAPQVPLISIKPKFGHLLGASSALNVVAALLMIQQRTILPSVFVGPADGIGGFREAHAAPCDHGLALSYGLGGHTAVVLLSREPEA